MLAALQHKYQFCSINIETVITEVTNRTSVEKLKLERNRFLAFAFSSADVLVELDKNHRIVFIEGAVSGFGQGHSTQLAGSDFIDLIYPDDAQLFVDNMLLETGSTRLNPLIIRLRKNVSGVDAASAKSGLDKICSQKIESYVITGCRLDCFDGHSYLSICNLSGAIVEEQVNGLGGPKSLLDKDQFIEAVRARILSASDSSNLKLTLLDLTTTLAVARDNDSAHAERLLEEICEYLQHYSEGAGGLGFLGSNQYAVLHDDKLSIEAVMRRITDFARRFMGNALPLPRHHTLNIGNVDLTDQDIARALLYTLNRFAEDAGDKFNISSLHDGFKAYLDDTMKKLSGFRQVVSSCNFDVALQPIVNMTAGGVHHYEALFRFENMDPFDSPSRFMTFGEQAGMIGDFDLAMLQKVINIIEENTTATLKPVVSVNVSGRSISSQAFCEMFRQVLHLSRVSKSQIIVEVTETAKIENLRKANEFLQSVRERGCTVCLDDFGSGESTFDYLRFLEVDHVKISGECIKHSAGNARSMRVMKCMIDMCRELGVTTIGERVDSQEVAQFLADNGVSFGQGYHYGRPSTNIKKALANPPAFQLIKPLSLSPPLSVASMRQSASTTTSGKPAVAVAPAPKPRTFSKQKPWWQK